VEIGNTDAEGRLVLADALALACEEKPDLLIDMGTLTERRGWRWVPIYRPFTQMMRRWLWTSRAVPKRRNDPLWRLPLWPAYDAWLDSKVANVTNAPSGTFAGSITCALFLQRFVEDAKAGCILNIYGWTPSRSRAAGRRRMPGRARDLQIARGTLWMIRGLTPARPDLAAKYLEGKIEAARFVEGREFEISGRSRAAARRALL